jgi:hypothetical protein
MMLALVSGFGAGTLIHDAPRIIGVAQLVGGVWLDGLRLTIVPLVFALIESPDGEVIPASASA